MAKGYWVVSVDVSDPEGYKLYIAENAKAFSKYGARFLATGRKSEIVEGKGGASIIIIIAAVPKIDGNEYVFAGGGCRIGPITICAGRAAN